jgi:hypothetical protein
VSFDKLRMTVGVFSVRELVFGAFSVVSYEVRGVLRQAQDDRK